MVDGIPNLLGVTALTIELSCSKELSCDRQALQRCLSRGWQDGSPIFQEAERLPSSLSCHVIPGNVGLSRDPKLYGGIGGMDHHYRRGRSS